MNAKALVAEFIGTFALTFIGAGAAALGVGGLVGVAFAHGLTLLAFAYAYGYISGTHINPAVTFGVALSGNMKWNEAISYWIAQLIGGAIAGAALFFILSGVDQNQYGATVLANGVTPLQGMIIEAILTFFLVNSVLHTAIKGKGGDFAGVAIGLTLTLSILLGGPLTGASLNPARTLGPAIFSGTLNLFWIYVIGTFAGAAVAVGVYKFME